MPKIYLVGGSVRDEILGLKSKDRDYTFVSEEKDIANAFNEMRQYLEKNNFQIFLETEDCFTIRAKFPNSKEVADFVLAREEIGYVENTRKPICIPSSLFKDLERRDFTVNALAKDEDGKIIDYFNGLEDLGKRILRTPIDPKITFLDDPLRLLRAIRFSITKDFNFSQELLELLSNENDLFKEIFNKLIVVVSPERIREELMKMNSFSTVDTMRCLVMLEYNNPSFNLKSLFGNIWLKPTFEKV